MRHLNREPSPANASICSLRCPQQITMSCTPCPTSSRSWCARKGSPSIMSSDFGTCVVNGCIRVASPPARSASAGSPLCITHPLISNHAQQCSAHRLTARVMASPAQCPELVTIQPHNRNIALPSTVATRVFEHRHHIQMQAFNRQFSNFRNCNCITCSDVESREILLAMHLRMQHRVHDIGDVNIGLALPAVA